MSIKGCIEAVWGLAFVNILHYWRNRARIGCIKGIEIDLIWGMIFLGFLFITE